ncbi:hypothetical protein BSKO_08030 [Bryopsis sp. KO-2023]|nr:hypothetical protein BSKO_08030 [Bryopsis sp. KO-2023]
MTSLGLNGASTSASIKPGRVRQVFGTGQHAISIRSSPNSSQKRRAALVEGPPETFTLAKNSDQTREHVKTNFPELLDLVDDGSLAVHLRPDDYVERRADGYKEPLEVFVLGTCHYSQKSADDALRLIEAVCPENVVVELCRSRVAVLYANDQQGENSPGSNADNPMSLSGENFFDAISRSLSLGGPAALALRALLGTVSKRLSGGFAMTSGAEMRAAQAASENVGAQIVLGDRPIEITLERTWESMNWAARWRFCSSLFSGLTVPSSVLNKRTDEIQKMLANMDEDLVSQWLSQLVAEFPEVGPTLVHERDMYLAWSLKRSKAVNGTNRVVGVVGRGHLRGIMYAMSHDRGDLRFSDLVGGKNKKENKVSKEEGVMRFLRRLVFEIALGYGCYVAWVEFVH